MNNNYKTKLGYGLGDFGLNFYWQGATYFLLFFYTDILGLPNSVAGAAYAIGGIIDAVSDPLMGYYADRNRSRWGKYRPFILYGSIPLGIAFFLLFAIPAISAPQYLLATTIIVAVIFRLTYTFVSIPYSALGVRLSYDTKERTRIAGIRMLFGALGGSIVVATISFLRTQYNDGTPFVWSASVFGLAGAVLLLLCFSSTAEKSAPGSNYNAPKKKYSPYTMFSKLIQNRPFVMLTGSIFFITLANMMLAKTVLYRFEYIFQASNFGNLTLTAMAILPLLTIPVWTWVYLSIDKKPAFTTGCLIAILGYLAILAFGKDSALVALIAYLVTAAGFGSFAVGFWSMLPDTIDYGHWKTGERIESGVIGISSAVQKLAIAFSGLLIGIVLDLSGYVAGISLSQENIERLHFYSTLLPLAFLIIAVLLIHKYEITKSVHKVAIDDLNNRHKGQSI